MKNILLDMSLIAEKRMLGDRSGGLARSALEITSRLLCSELIHTSASSFIGLSNYYDNTRDYLKDLRLDFADKLIDERPCLVNDIFKVNGFWYKYALFRYNFSYQNSKAKIDFFHSFYYPFSKLHLKNRTPLGITFHDLEPLKSDVSSKWVRKLTNEIINSARYAKVVCISNFSRDEMLNYDSSIDSNRVEVIYNAACKATFFRNLDKSRWDLIKFKYGLRDEFIFCLSSTNPRKNIKSVILMFDRLCKDLRFKEYQLLLAGNSNITFKDLSDFGIKGSTINRIVLPSFPFSDNELSVLYSRTKCFVNLSFYEGFGLPLLEAMQCGAPCVVSRIGAFTEVGENACLYTSPLDIEECCVQVSNVLEDDVLSSSLSKSGLNRAGFFSWEKTANSYLEFFLK